MASSKGMFESDKAFEERIEKEANEVTIQQKTGSTPSQGFFEADSAYDDRIDREAKEVTISGSTSSSQGFFEADSAYDDRIDREAKEARINQKAKITSNQLHEKESNSSYGYSNAKIYSSISKIKYNSSNNSQKSSISNVWIVFTIILLFFIYGYISPYFGKYPIDYNYKHSYGVVKKIIPTKYNKHILLGEGDFIAVTDKPKKSGRTPLTINRWTTNPRPYIVVSLNKKGSNTWVRRNFYDGHLVDIVSNKNGDFVIVGDGLKHDKESFISIRKYNSVKQEIFNKKYFLTYTKDDFFWAEQIISTPEGFAIYAKFKKNKKYYDAIISINDNGKVLWAKSFKKRYSRSYKNDKIIRVNNYFYLISSYENEPGKPSYLGISKVSLTGQFIWQKKYLDNNRDTSIKVHQVLNILGNIKIIGTIGNTIYDITYKENDKTFYDKKYRVGDDCDVKAVIITGENNYLAVGSIGTFNDDGCIVELNQYGKKIWSQTYGESKRFNNIYIENGGYIITGIADNWFWEDDKKYWSVMKIKNDKEKFSTMLYNKGSQSTPFVAPINSTNIKKQTFNKDIKKPTYKKLHYQKGKYRVIKIRSNDTLNVRTNAGTHNRKFGNLAYNAKGIRIIKCKKAPNGIKWCKVSHSSIMTGWVSAKYLGKERAVNAFQKTSVPVVVKGKTIGNVRGISRNGDGFIAIRSGPGAKYKMIDKLYRNGKKVIIADKKGKWKGLVYGNGNCGTDLSKKKGKAYEGFCKTGWVYGKYVVKEVITVKKKTPKTKHKHKKRARIKGIVNIGSLMYQNQPRTRLYTWQGAKRYCRNLTWRGYRAWKLPTTRELEDLLTKNKMQGSNGKYYIRREFINNLSGTALFWTSETNGNATEARGINFGNKGYYWLKMHYKNNTMCVR